MTFSRASVVFLGTWIFCICGLAGCGGKNPIPLLHLERGPDLSRPSALVTGDPEGPVPAPQIPPDLAARAKSMAAQPAERPANAERLPYRLKVTSPQNPELAESFERASLLKALQDQPPATVTGLEQRLRSDRELADRVLQSYGYYAGAAMGRITLETPENPRSALVEVHFDPGVQYRVGLTSVETVRRVPTAAQNPQLPLSTAPGTVPSSLEDVGLEPGAPAVADHVLAAVDAAREAFRDNGYPYAEVADSRYFLDHGQRQLDARVRIAPGPLVYMGPLEVQGAVTVRRSYLDALRTWDEGQLWNQSQVETFREALVQSGLFQSADLHPGRQADADGRRPVVAELVSGPERTIGAAVKYNTDFGPGLLGYWEHRNLTGRGDRLRLDLPLWADMQQLAAQYRQPFFHRKDQDFLAQAGILHESTDAYELLSGSAAAGVERRLSRWWKVTLQGHVEGGELKDPDRSRKSYLMFGLPASATYDTTGNLLDAVRGYRVILGASPYTGVYEDHFTVVRLRAEGQAFWSLAEEDRLVLAARAAAGSVAGADGRSIPATLRFYSGGGGSVRGYAYQSLGPRNQDDDPLGGASMIETSTELRWKITPEWGVVAFVDGGMAYDKAFAGLGKDMRWGAGLGVRYYTVIGPVRLDLATPLNPRHDDDSVQLYISIGQNF